MTKLQLRTSYSIGRDTQVVIRHYPIAPNSQCPRGVLLIFSKFPTCVFTNSLGRAQLSPPITQAMLFSGVLHEV